MTQTVRRRVRGIVSFSAEKGRGSGRSGAAGDKDVLVLVS
jgi:hypothetical protein